MLVVYLRATRDSPPVITEVRDSLIPDVRWLEFRVGPKGSWSGQWNKDFNQSMTRIEAVVEVFRQIESIVDSKMNCGLSIEKVVIITQSGMVDFLPHQANPEHFRFCHPLSVHTSRYLTRLAQKLDGLYICGADALPFLPDIFEEHQPCKFQRPQQELLQFAKPKGWDPEMKRMTQANPQRLEIIGPRQLPSITQLLGPVPDLQQFAWRQVEVDRPDWKCTVRLQSLSSRDPSHWAQEQFKLRQETLTMEKVGLCERCTQLRSTCTPAHHGLAWNPDVGTFAWSEGEAKLFCAQYRYNETLRMAGHGGSPLIT